MQIVESISTVVAPLALVTAVFGYIGWIRTRAFYNYFGINSSLVSYSPQDYVLQSTDAGFGAVLLLGLTGAILLGLDRVLIRLLEGGGRWENGMRRVLVGLGAALVLVSLGGAVPDARLAIIPPNAGAVLLALGVVVFLRFGAGSGERVGLLPHAAIGLAVVMLVLAGFWATTSYANDLGVGAAEAFDRDPRSLAIVTVFSGDPLDIPGTNVDASRVLDQDQEWNYRYTGARLLVYSNSRWFLITEPGSPTYRPSVTVLPDTDTIRVETTVPRS